MVLGVMPGRAGEGGGGVFLGWDELGPRHQSKPNAGGWQDPDAKVPPATAVRLLSVLERNGVEQAIAEAQLESIGQPDCAFLENFLGLCEQRRGNEDAAVRHFREALNKCPSYWKAHLNLANALFFRNGAVQAGKAQEVLHHYQVASRARPESPEILTNLVTVLEMLGQGQEALECLERGIAAMPGVVELHTLRADRVTFHANDDRIGPVRELLETSEKPGKTAIACLFILAKAAEDAGQTNEAFAHYVAGNAMRRHLEPYSGESDQQFARFLGSAFDREQPPLPSPAHGSGGFRPIFILGMPRSGSTLVEQILGRHPDVEIGGELPFFPEAIGAHWEVIGRGTSNPWAPDLVGDIRKRYLESIERKRAGKPCLTDKMPFNFWYIGFILRALPEAAIVHTRRSAAAVCWSIFRTNFLDAGMAFGCDLCDVARYYRNYSQIMEMWDRLYPGRIYSVGYEDLTKSPETEIRRLVEHLGMEWRDDLVGAEPRRLVFTASHSQVRKPIYQGSSQAWEKYRTLLGPLLEILGQHGGAVCE